MTRSSFLGEIGRMLGGPLVWSVHFGAIYGFAALVCAGRIGAAGPFGFAAIPLFTLFASLVACGAIAVLILRTLRTRPAADEPPVDGFMAALTLLTGGGAILAVAWNTLPALIEPACAPA
jgi:hypothetical protein